MGAVGYMPIIDAEDLDEFEARVRETIPGYVVFELDEAGNRVPVGDRDEYVPVQWFEPDDAFGAPHGFDSASEPRRRAAVELARSSGELAVTPFLQLVSEDESDGFVVYWPVTDPDSRVVVGFTLAPMDLSELLESQISQAFRDDLVWNVTDLGDTPPVDQVADGGWTRLLNVGGREWMLTVTRSVNSSLNDDPAELLVVVVVGLIASVLAAAGVYLYRERSHVRQELDQIKELTRAKDQFLASISHELRTPLTGVLGFAELLRDDHEGLSDEERRVMIGSVADEAADLSYIIDDLLVEARSELDLLVVTRVPVSARAQVAQVLEAAGNETCQRVEIIGDADQAYRMVGDPARVRQILRNLISNACRYGGEQIQVRFAISNQSVRIQLADNGAGLPPEEWERIFEPYYRAHYTDSQPAALGIGLSVARHLARLMGGDLAYRWEDGWSVFELGLNAAEGQNPEQAPTEPSVADAISVDARV